MKNLAITLLVFLSLVISPNLFAQNVSVNADGSLADTSAMLDVSSTTKGFLLPRMTTTQQNAIILPSNGLTIFNTTLNSIMINTGTSLSPVWSALASGAIDTSSIANFSVKIRSLFSGTAPITYSNGLIGITQAGTSSDGYLSSTDWNTFNNKQPQLNGTGFVKASGTTISYDNSTYLTGNQTISFTPTAAGDVTGSTTGTTTLGPVLLIGTNKVSNTKLAQMPALTIKGNNTGGTANASDLTVAQVNAILPVFTSTLNGLAPLSGGGTTNFLRADGSWTAPSSNAWNITGNTGIAPATNFIGTIGNNSLRFRTNNTENMIIDSTGNVGIGISAFDPVQPEKLLVNAGTYPYNGAYKSTTPINAIGASNGYQQIQVQNRSYGNYSSSDLVAASDGTANGTQPVNTEINYVDLGINSSGYTNSNSNILNLPYTSYLYATSPQTFYIGNGYSGEDIVFFTNHGPTNTNNTADGYEIMRLMGGTAQQVTIGTPTPNGTNKLTVSGSISASAFNVSSDRRLKTNITSLRYGLKEVLALQPVSYNWKKSPATDKQLGLIAQDAKKEIPEIVSGNEKTGTLSINYTELVPVLINAIREQQQQIDTLKKDIQLLKDKK
jgi:hypothetical protein